MEQAILTVRNQSTGETASYDASELAAGAALFRISYALASRVHTRYSEIARCATPMAAWKPQ